MSRRKKESRPPKPIRKSAKPPKSRGVLVIVLSSAVIAAIGLVLCLIFFTSDPSTSSEAFNPIKPARNVKSLDELLTMSPEQLDEVDIGEMNLLCAAGLPGAENLDVEKALSRLDDYALKVRYWTDKSMSDFRLNPDKFANSQAKFRVLLLISVLQKEFGVLGLPAILFLDTRGEEIREVRVSGYLDPEELLEQMKQALGSS